MPDNVPNPEKLKRYLGKPLTEVPDPFTDEYPSFGAGNNARLRAFLDRFGFEYEFMSATETYRSGRFDATLLKMLAELRGGEGDHPADARARAPRHLFAVPADRPRTGNRAAGADHRARPGSRHNHLHRSGNRRGGDDASSPAGA